ncbi:Clp protease ClpP [Labilibacter sediminis]|nr:Clp protease ClpP [Labilibacter sediminis]
MRLICGKKDTMAKTTFDIDGYIGSGAYSRQFVKAMLKNAGTNPVQCNMSSLGGDLNHGIGIHDQFVDHGDVTSRLSGFVASSATVAACGSKHVKMNSTAFYLVHKVMTWEDEWGYMNEDDLQAVIDKLTQDKEENQKMDLMIAQIYVARTGKPLNEIVDLMKKNTWLSAQEAKEWGFVDEIVTMTAKQNFLEDPAKVAMISAAGLPIPTRKENPSQSNSNQNIEETIEKANNSLFDRLKNLIPGQKDNSNNNSKTNMDGTKFAALFAALGVTAMESTNEGVYLNMQQMEKINTALADAVTAKANLQTAQNERNTVINALDDIDPTVKAAEGHQAKIDVVKARLAAKPGAAPTGNDGGDGGAPSADGADWDVINNLPHNKAADEDLI